MKRLVLSLFLAFLVLGCEQATELEDPQSPTVQVHFDEGEDEDEDEDEGRVVPVAPPTGDAATDIASIEAAIAAAEPGDVIQFHKGVYAVAEAGGNHLFEVSTPGVTLRGHERGTTIAGNSIPAAIPVFWLNGGHQTVRNLTFDGTGNAIDLGWSNPAGGYRVEGCTFRQGFFGVDIAVFSDDVITVQDNKFINMLIPFRIFGNTLHFRENEVTAPDPESVVFGQPFNAGIVAVDFFFGNGISENNVFEENTIIGNADGFIFFGTAPGTAMRDQVIRENTFIDQRVFTPSDFGTMVWLISSDVGTLEGIRIEDNELRGSEGIGIILSGDPTNNWIVENEFSDLRGPKDGPPGEFLGTGVFLDEPSSFNRVIENEFENVLTPILDLGTDNIIADNEIEEYADEDGDNGSDGIQAAPVASVQTAAMAQETEKIRLIRAMVRQPK